MLGVKLSMAISKIHPQLAGKITGMILEMDNSELLRMPESDQQLEIKVEEALQVLAANTTGQQGRVSPRRRKRFV